MIILQKDNHAALYTIDEETKELYYAPIYKDNIVNLSEFALVDLDDEEVLEIQQQLIQLNQ